MNPTDELNHLQSIIARFEEHFFKTRGWLVLVLSGIIVGTYSGTIDLSFWKLLGVASFAVLLFAGWELAQRGPHQLAERRVGAIEEEVRSGQYGGPDLYEALARRRANYLKEMQEITFLIPYAVALLACAGAALFIPALSSREVDDPPDEVMTALARIEDQQSELPELIQSKVDDATETIKAETKEMISSIDGDLKNLNDGIARIDTKLDDVRQACLGQAPPDEGTLGLFTWLIETALDLAEASPLDVTKEALKRITALGGSALGGFVDGFSNEAGRQTAIKLFGGKEEQSMTVRLQPDHFRIDMPTFPRVEVEPVTLQLDSHPIAVQPIEVDVRQTRWNFSAAVKHIVRWLNELTIDLKAGDQPNGDTAVTVLIQELSNVNAALLAQIKECCAQDRPQRVVQPQPRPCP